MDYSKLTKEEIIDGIKKEVVYIERLSEQWRDNKEVVLTAIKQNGKALYYVSDSLKDDKDIGLEAVKQHGLALTYASERLRDDKEIVLEAVKNYGWALGYASKRLQNDKELLEILEKKDLSYFDISNMNWLIKRMDILALLREKEFIENSINPSNIKQTKIKF